MNCESRVVETHKSRNISLHFSPFFLIVSLIFLMITYISLINSGWKKYHNHMYLHFLFSLFLLFYFIFLVITIPSYLYMYIFICIYNDLVYSRGERWVIGTCKTKIWWLYPPLPCSTCQVYANSNKS